MEKKSDQNVPPGVYARYYDWEASLGDLDGWFETQQDKGLGINVVDLLRRIDPEAITREKALFVNGLLSSMEVALELQDDFLKALVRDGKLIGLELAEIEFQIFHAFLTDKIGQPMPAAYEWGVKVLRNGVPWKGLVAESHEASRLENELKERRKHFIRFVLTSILMKMADQHRVLPF